MSEGSEKLLPGPGYAEVKGKSQRQINSMMLERHAAGLRIADCIVDDHDLERIRKGVLEDLFFLDLLELACPRPQSH